MTLRSIRKNLQHAAEDVEDEDVSNLLKRVVEELPQRGVNVNDDGATVFLSSSHFSSSDNVVCLLTLLNQVASDFAVELSEADTDMSAPFDEIRAESIDKIVGLLGELGERSGRDRILFDPQSLPSSDTLEEAILENV